MPQVDVFADLSALSRQMAEELVQLAAVAVRERGQFSLVLAGGSTPKVLYQELATPRFAERMPWQDVHVFWGDERCVPPDNEKSNYRMANDALLSKVPLPKANAHRMHGEDEPPRAAQLYENELQTFFADACAVNGWTRFDLVLLGMGDDGHTASLFPGSDAIEEREHLVAAVWVEKFSMWRITLTPVAINTARHVRFLVSGNEKANALAQVLYGSQRPRELPAQIVKPSEGDLRWFVTSDAAASLKTTT